MEKYKVTEISDLLAIPAASIKRQCQRMDLPTDELNTEQAAQLVACYTAPRANRPADTPVRAQEFLGQLGHDVPAPQPAPRIVHTTPPLAASPRWRGATPTAAPVRPPRPMLRPGVVVRVGRSEAVAVALFGLVAIWQALNTIELVGWLQTGAMSMSWRAALFGAPVQLTALVLTLHNGGRWYLRGFAGFEFAVNLLHGQPWRSNSPEVWATVLLTSSLAAFAILSFSEIFGKYGQEK